ncbi:cytochrome d ubiquinol oxidase subunit II [Streptomyces sp. ISL-22]|uniref:cytochrome d ubiquinol oxidase subunit II n=1 Tax=unclassified Streptomyces TaxID=2593676 RepID=UPI001BEC6A16|nr:MULTISPECIES: cytochrome d ubiquinol oxidase subunit II [unclassified Streptomyces]MBT2421876.1 cytochrome d ubiquinol oxidase subunit II [Streptomyces sp. ISL-24]MBT2437286.1 cytochrome d ubiquinol oxidase subunit II [Streptomyces sp. ISL-22]
MLADATLAVMWVGLTCYALFGGADFGAGLWDLLAGGTRRGMPRRKLIEHTIAPVWEANHVWLIFVIVLLWAGFSPVFAAVLSTLYIPLTLAAVGIIARGAAFAFRKASTQLWQQRLFGACFALSSVLTPFFLGTVAGGVASGRVPPGLAEGDVITSWLNPTSALGGVLAVLTCAHLAAVYLCADAARQGDPGLVTWFWRRAVMSGLASGAVALAGIAVLHADAPRLFHGLTHRALPLVVLSACTGLAALVLLHRYPVVARGIAALAVASILWAWGAAQYPAMLVPDVTVAEAASHDSVLAACLISLAVGAVLLIPSLWWLYANFQRRRAPQDAR